MAAVSDLRLQDYAEYVHVLFVEGLPYAWVTEGGGDLLGSGAGTWMGESESDAGLLGDREILPGLKVPGSISVSRDPSTGEIDKGTTRFSILDTDDRVVQLFASEGKTSQILRQRIPPGTASLPEFWAAPGVSQQLSIFDKYVGIEKVGPAGERAQFPPIPFDIVGPEHFVHRHGDDTFPPVLVSDEPIEFSGRIVSLYRIYKDLTSSASGQSAWPRWLEQHNAGNLVWWGKMRDGGDITPGRMWSVECFGPDALLYRRLGRHTIKEYKPVTAITTLVSSPQAAREDRIAVGFWAFTQSAVADPWHLFRGMNYPDSLALTQLTNRNALAAEINSIVQEVATNASYSHVNVNTGSTTVHAWGDPYKSGNDVPNNRRFGPHEAWISVSAHEPPAHTTVLYWKLGLHRKVWSDLGWSIDEQTQRFIAEQTSPTDVFFVPERPYGTTSYGPTWETSPAAPGYVWALFHSASHGYIRAEQGSPINDGNPRVFMPLHRTGGFSFLRDGNQSFLYHGEERAYLRGQPVLMSNDQQKIDGVNVNNRRFFAFRGKMRVLKPDVEQSTQGSRGDEDETKDVNQVALVSWVGSDGLITSGSTQAIPQLRLERWVDPRSFGFENPPLDRDWAGAFETSERIEAVPLNSYAYTSTDKVEKIYNVVTRVMLSTGTAEAYGTFTTGGLVVDGENSPPSLPNYGDISHGKDRESADMGLAIPKELVADLESFRSECGRLPNGYNSALNRGRVSFIGGFETRTMFSGLLRPRGLGWSLHGKKYGIQFMSGRSSSDVDISITEDDLFGKQGDPASTVPSQKLRSLGQIDNTVMSYRSNVDGQTELEISADAMDSNSSRRNGDSVVEFEELGLIPFPWYPSGPVMTGITGSPPWDGEFKELWGKIMPAFFDKRHTTVSLRVSRPKGQDMMPGTVVLLSNPWVVNPTGTYGVVRHVGVVNSVSIGVEGEYVDADIMVFAGQLEAPPHFAPIAKIKSVTGAVIEYYDDFLGHGNTSYNDATAFEEPAASGIGGTTLVDIVERDIDSWSIVANLEVASVDTGANTITLTAPPSLLRDTDKYIILRPYDAQDALSWTRSVFGPIVLDTLKHGAVPTDGKEFR